MSALIVSLVISCTLFSFCPLSEAQFKSGIITGRNLYLTQGSHIQKRQDTAVTNEGLDVVGENTNVAYDSPTTVSYGSSATPYENAVTVPYESPIVAQYENPVTPYSAPAEYAVRPEIQVQVYCSDCNVEMYNLTDPNVNHTIPAAIRNMFPFLQL